jgi:hypothetical protein
MHHVSHFQFLARRDVTQAIVRVLRQDVQSGRGRRGRDNDPRSQPGSEIQDLDEDLETETGEEEFDSHSGAV